MSKDKSAFPQTKADKLWDFCRTKHFIAGVSTTMIPLMIIVTMMYTGVTDNADGITDNTINIAENTIALKNIDRTLTSLDNTIIKLDDRLDKLTLVMCDMSDGKYCK